MGTTSRYEKLRFISICGTDEIAAGKINVKNLATGQQCSFAKDDISAIAEFVMHHFMAVGSRACAPFCI